MKFAALVMNKGADMNDMNYAEYLALRLEGAGQNEAAAELRRLHSEVEQLREFLKEIYDQKSMNSRQWVATAL